MIKYDYEFKKRVVDAYLNGEGSYAYLAKRFAIPSRDKIKLWVDRYKAFGDDGLKPAHKKTYSFEKKLSVVQLYLSGNISYNDLAIRENISEPAVITYWVKRFKEAGPDSLLSSKKGQKETLGKSKEKNHTQPAETPVDASAERIKELEDELLKLRIENAFLKEMRRLRLEDEAKMRERLESLTASEDNSN